MEKERGMKKERELITSSLFIVIPSTERINDKVIADTLEEEIDVTAGASLISHATISKKAHKFDSILCQNQ